MLTIGSQVQKNGPVDIVDSACKVLPNNKAVSLGSVLIRQTDNDQSTYWWLVGLLDNRQQRHVLASYQSPIYEDASIEVREDSIWLDTAPYMLARNVRAMGVRLAIGHVSGCVDGASDNYLTLFIRRGNKLLPVLKDLPTSYWRYRRGWPCSYDPKQTPVIENVHSLVAVLKHQHHGFYDLRIIGHGVSYRYKQGNSKDKLISRQKYMTDLKFNGQEYNKGAWNNLPSPAFYSPTKP